MFYNRDNYTFLKLLNLNFVLNFTAFTPLARLDRPYGVLGSKLSQPYARALVLGLQQLNLWAFRGGGEGACWPMPVIAQA